MKTKNTIGLFLILSLMTGTAFAITGNATPSQYAVNLQNVEFGNAASGAFFTYRSGSSNINIASVLPNEPCASLGPSATPPAGTYNQFRVTVSKTMTVKAASNGNLADGQPCRSDPSGALVNNPFGDGSITAAYLGVRDGAAGQSQTVIVPTGTSVILPSGVVDAGSSIQVTMPVNFTVGNSVPQGTVAFNVTNSVLFAPITSGTYTGQCVVMPVPPTITVNVG